MHPVITALAKRVLSKTGFELRRTHPWYNDPYRWLRDFAPKTVLDIGANSGQFAHTLRELFPPAQIYSFEPLAEPFQQLIADFSGDTQFRGFNVALGNEDGRQVINRSSSSTSSSLLKMGKIHREEYPYTAQHVTEEIAIRRLDGLVDDGSIVLDGPLFIKLDVQGYELEVIRGGKRTVSAADAVFSEVSFVELYEKQPLFTDLLAELQSLDFVFLGLATLITHHETNRPLYGDAVFAKTGHPLAGLKASTLGG
jgi:FkbM family methyltransferase